VNEARSIRFGLLCPRARANCVSIATNESKTRERVGAVEWTHLEEMAVGREDGDGAIVWHDYVLTVVSRSSESVAFAFKSGARERRAMRVVPWYVSRVIMRRGGGGA